MFARRRRRRSGGGIYNLGVLTLINSTVSRNGTNGDTITENRTDFFFNGTGIGGGVFNESGGAFFFQNTIIAGNPETRFDDMVLFRWVSTFGDCAGTLTSLGNNTMRTVNCVVNGIRPILDTAPLGPLLGPLQNNGGPTDPCLAWWQSSHRHRQSQRLPG